MTNPLLTNEPEDSPPNPSLAKTLVGALAITAVLIGATAWVYQQLPADAQVPLHWNAEGQIDSRGPRATLFLIPALMAVLSVVFFVVPRFEPRRGNLMRSAGAYRLVWLGLVVFFGVLQGLILATAAGVQVPFNQLLLSGLGLLLAIVGNSLGKVRSNFIFGCRTPWALSSDLAWNRTHRLSGGLFVGTGLILVVVAWAIPDRAYVVLFGMLAVVVLLPTGYSYWVWRTDPQRRT